jgi:hypothetical protein
MTGSDSDEVVTEVSSVLCYITTNLTAFIKCVKDKTPALSPNTVAHSLTLQTCILTVQTLAISEMNLTENSMVFCLYSKHRVTVLKQDTASKCDIETKRCTYVEVYYTHSTPPLFGHKCGVAILKEVHYQG